ncbi:MAG: serine/threonine protein kinase [Thermoprotei archaeon]
MRLDITRIISQSVKQTKVVERGGRKCVLKCYEGVTGAKWYLLTPVFQLSYPFVASPEDRMERELDFFTSLKGKVNVPNVIDFDLDKKCVLREFVDGELPKTSEDYALIARELRRVHDWGFVMGDTKPENFVVKGGKAIIIDAEQAIQSNDDRLRAWDLAVLFTFVSHYTVNDLEEFRRLVRAIRDGYNGSESVVNKVFDLKHSALLAFIPPIHQYYLRKELVGTR